MSVKRLVLLLALAVLLSPGGAAAKKKTPPPPDGAPKPSEVVWDLRRDGVSVSVTASDDLNFAYGTPLALTLCLFQLSDATKFSAYTASPAGIAALITDGSETLGGALLAREKILLQPGEKKSLTFDRAAGAKYFAALAGYAHQDPPRCAAWIPFPIDETAVKARRRKTVYYTAGVLSAEIFLDSGALALTGGKHE